MLQHIMHTYVSNKSSQAKDLQIHRMIQEEMSIFSEIISVFVRSKRFHMNMYPILNGNQDRAVSLSRPNFVSFFL